MGIASLSAAYVVANRFDGLLQRTAPTSAEQASYLSHARTIERALITHLDANKLVTMGSYRRGSACRSLSDMDLLAVLPVASARHGSAWKSSTAVMANVRRLIEYRYPSTEVGKDGQAIVVNFGQGQRPVDVVPGVWRGHGGAYNYPQFAIPDGNGDWMLTSPETHDRYIRDADRRAGGKLKYTARLVRFWAHTRLQPVALSGFYVEMLLANTRLCEGAKSYSSVLRDLLVQLSNSRCAAVTDPTGVSLGISACSTPAKLQRTISSVYASALHADAAIAAETRGAGSEALRQWELVFNGQF